MRMKLDVNQLPKPFQLNALDLARVAARVRVASLDVRAMNVEPCGLRVQRCAGTTA